MKEQDKMSRPPGCPRLLGFTLVELMIVVAIIGVLAAVAIPSFQKYIKKSKTVEVMLNLRKIYDGEVTYYTDEHVLESGQTAPRSFVPTRCEPFEPPGNKKRFGNFDQGNWPSIHFSVDSPILYSYLVETDGSDPALRPSWVPGYGWEPAEGSISAGFLARAFGDTDGDGSFSQFARFAVVKTGQKEIEGQPGIFSIDENE